MFWFICCAIIEISCFLKTTWFCRCFARSLWLYMLILSNWLIIYLKMHVFAGLFWVILITWIQVIISLVVNCSRAFSATTCLATLPPDRRLSNMVDKIASLALLPWMADWLLNGCWWIELVGGLMIKLLNVFKIFICNVEWIFFFAFPLILREALIHWWIRFQRLWIMQLFNAILVANRHWLWCECVAPLLLYWIICR